jgi:uncharacterized protein (TIGR00255 family)
LEEKCEVRKTGKFNLAKRTLPFSALALYFGPMKSMTGFGRGEVSTEDFRLRVELSSVNRKQSDIVVNLPREWSGLEIDTRKLIAGAVSRGRVQVQVQVEPLHQKTVQLQVDADLARQYVEAMRQLTGSLALAGELTPSDLLRAPGVFSTGEVKTTAESVWPHLEIALSSALEAFSQSRTREGAHLQEDLQTRLALVEQLAASIALQTPEVVKAYHEQMRKRLAEAGLPLPLDDERLLKEIALFADKCDISEEVTRLHGHIAEFRRLMASKEPQGRALDFLTQELHRELNTMGSKGNSTSIAHLVVTGKTEVERIREQVQNVE